MLYDGLFSRPAGLIYGSFDETRHKIPRTAIPPEWPRFLGLDFGGANTAGAFFAQERAGCSLIATTVAAIARMSAPTRLASYLAVSRWANQATEVALLEGRTVDADLFKDDALLRPLWNLYPDHDLRKEDGRRQFLAQDDSH